MRIREVMTTRVEVIDSEASVQEAAKKMRDLRVGLLPVVTAKGLIGVLTDRDITVRVIAAGLDPASTGVDRAMSLGVVACFADQDVEDAAAIMHKRRIQHLLVLDENRKPVGVLSSDELRPRN